MKKLFLFIAAALVSTGMWANQTDLISGVTLPDIPASSLDMASQTFMTPDENGWIVMNPNADVRNASVTWFSALAWNSGSVTISKVDTFIAPFYALNSVSCTNVKKTERTKAIRFKGATHASFLASSTSNSYNFHVALYSYDGDTQTLIGNKSTGNVYRELIFSGLSSSTDYIAYFYASNNSNAVIAEIAIKKYIAPVVDPVASVTIAGPTRGTKNYPATFTATTDVKADYYQWFVNDEAKEGATSKTFSFTPETAGDYSIVCKARNANNAADEWIASAPIAFKAVNSLMGELIKATLTSGSAATVTGLVGGTADVSLSSNLKMDDEKYFGITLASGNFHEGDTVVITMTTYGQNYPCLFADKARTTCLFLATETSTALEYKIVLPAAANSINKLYLARKDNENYKWNPVLSSMSVIRPMATKSTVVDLTSVAINEEAISSDDLDDLKADGSLELATSYVNAPTVVFNKRTTITYEDDSQKVIDNPIEVTASVNGAGKWEAEATIGEDDYTITMVKTASVVVTYKFGERTLGIENVAIGGHPADYATYQTLNDGGLSEFVDWYNNADLAEGHKVADISAETITGAVTYYAKFTYFYAESINIEQYALDNHTTGQTKMETLMSNLGTLHYASNVSYSKGNNEVDSLNDDPSKTNRNYAYLGLKIKKSDALLKFRLANGKTLKIKFGNRAAVPQVSINGGDYAEMTFTDNIYTYTATADALIAIKPGSAGALVFKQIMIDEAIKDITLPWRITFDSDGGSAVADVIVLNGQAAAKPANPTKENVYFAGWYNGENAYDWTAAVTANLSLTAHWSDVPTALDKTQEEAAAVKRIVNGQIFIEKNGHVYNVLGGCVK